MEQTMSPEVKAALAEYKGIYEKKAARTLKGEANRKASRRLEVLWHVLNNAGVDMDVLAEEVQEY